MTWPKTCYHCEESHALRRFMDDRVRCRRCAVDKPTRSNAEPPPYAGRRKIIGMLVHHYAIQERGIVYAGDTKSHDEKVDLERAIEHLRQDGKINDTEYNVLVGILLNRRRQKDLAEELECSRETLRIAQISVINKLNNWLAKE